MTNVAKIAKAIKSELKTAGINAKVKSCRGFELDAIYVSVPSELHSIAYQLTRKFENDDIAIITKTL